MILYRTIKDYFSQISALTEKDLRLELRFKLKILMGYLTNLISIIIPLIIMRKFFEFNSQFGPWTINNYYIYTFLAYNLILLRRFIIQFPKQFQKEKFWRTIDALIIAPFNRFNLLFGIFFSQLILISLPITVFFVLSYIIYPISFMTLLTVLGLYILIALIFSGIGLIIGIFAISNENIMHIITFLITSIFWFSCITYPYEFFPIGIQALINLNPLYYIFDIIRLVWIEDNIFISFTSHSFHFLIIFIAAVIFPCLGVLIFNKVYKKFGIIGYA